MSTAVAPASAAPLPSPRMNRDSSPRRLAPANSSSQQPNSTPPRAAVASRDGSSNKSSPSGKKVTSPSSQNGNNPPKVVVKKEPPSSPGMQTHSRPRPRKLDLSTSLPTSERLSARAPGGPMTARDVSMQNVGIACLSPGFQTQDPVMREQLQRSLSVRDQQRHIIEARLQKSAKDDGPDGVKPSESNPFSLPKTGSSKRRAPPGLSIVPPTAAQFANERVVQSAPLNQTFTGRHQPQPLTRHIVNQSPTLGSTSHIHHVPATQTSNRLPPLSDVFGSDALAASRERDANRTPYYQGSTASNINQPNNLPPLPSPRIPGSAQQSNRPREYRSAEEAVQDMSGGREDLLPRIVHYGGHQPPTPPSPRTAANGPKSAMPHLETVPLANAHAPQNPAPYITEGTARRRTRSEYERDNGSPPLGYGPDLHYRPNPALGHNSSAAYGPFGAARDSPETQRRKKEEFLGLCARAWDLFHS